jgi:Raf kinase inhibitor-like YbhB/YbcL family protein
MKLRVLIFLCLGSLLLAACAAPAAEPTEAPPVEEAPEEPTAAPEPAAPPTATEVPPEPTEAPMPLPFELTSILIAHEQPIPVRYSCDGEDVSPPLDWGDPPAGTQSFALIMDDPDAPGGTWDHWILFNIPADMRGLEENLPITGKNQEPGSIFVGNNSWGRADYGGPCPPGGTHRYFFKLYALDTTISLLPGVTKQELLSAMEGHILGEAELMGTYSR